METPVPPLQEATGPTSQLIPDAATGHYTVPVPMEGYTDLICTIANLLKGALLALDAPPTSDPLLQGPEMSSRNLIVLALHLLPYEAAEYLDRIPK